MSSFFDHSPAAPKICGITNQQDALDSIEAGCGALGFNFYPLSPRSIKPHDDLAWIQEIKKSYPDVSFIAVVVNPDAALLQKLREADCFDAIQFHGDESPEFCIREGAFFPYWIKALRIRSEEDLAVATDFQTPFLLLDAAVPGSYGGSGHTLNWGLAAKFIVAHPQRGVILAGGLTPENVMAAIAKVHPHAVDVASGVERAPGQKDADKVRALIAASLTH